MKYHENTMEFQINSFRPSSLIIDLLRCGVFRDVFWLDPRKVLGANGHLAQRALTTGTNGEHLGRPGKPLWIRDPSKVDIADTWDSVQTVTTSEDARRRRWSDVFRCHE